MQPTQSSHLRFADTALQAAAGFWFLAALAGQSIFVAYILSFHVRALLLGDLSGPNKLLPHGYVAGIAIGNLTLALHLCLAALITASGALQLIPQVRTRFPAFHRWNGRIYVLVALIMALTGLGLTLTGRKLAGDVSQHIAINTNAVLIVICALMAWRTAVARNFSAHRRWALRLFLVVSGVWFFRVGLMFWLALNKAPVGFDPKSFSGPFLTILAFAQYLLPLAVLEIYLRAESSNSPSGKLATSAALVLLLLAMSVGIFVATVGIWLPKMHN